jgi:predicted aldo/keto reductase-like oxidoreductase
MGALTRAKEAGKVRAVGFSCHGLGALRAAAQDEWSEVLLVRINHAGVNMDGTLSEVVPVLEDLYAAGKGLYAMKVAGCGRLAGDMRSAMRYVLDLGVVHSLSIGTSSQQQLTENVTLMEALAPQYPLRSRPEHGRPDRRTG